MRLSLTLLALVLCAPAMAEPSVRYANPEMLVEAADLERLLGDLDAPLRQPPPQLTSDGRALTLLDVRPAKAFEAGTLPGARRVDAGQWKAAFSRGEDAAAWSDRLSRVLAAPDSTVVVFDQTVSPTAARVWWLLKYWGIQDVRILNGGLQQWQAGNRKLWLPAKVKSAVPFTAKPQPARLAQASDVLRSIAAADTPACLIDTRTTSEVQAGFIPTASHSDWVAYVDPKTGKMRSPEELQALLDEAGFDAERGTITYCRSGGRASVVAFAAELMGGRQVANYVGSWGEWSKLPEAPVQRP